MKRFHINLNVSDLNQSILFYKQLFQAEPTVVKQDYAKWMLEDPRINFSINNRMNMSGVNHLGIQAEDADEFSEIEQRLNAADAEVFDQGDTTCCYAKSTKAWIRDPDGISWETFMTHGEATTYNGEELPETPVDSSLIQEKASLSKSLGSKPHGNCC